MSWHDLIDDASVRRFVSGGSEHNSNDDTLYDTELIEEDESHGITIVSSVPTAILAAQENDSGVLIESTSMWNDSLSLHPSSVATSVLTDAASLELSEVVTETSSLGSPVAVDRDSDASIATQEDFTASTFSMPHQQSQKQMRMEAAAKEWFLKSNTSDDWDREKDNILRILSAVDADCKDPDRLLAELLDDEEKVWRSSAAAKVKTANAALAFWDMALMGAVLSLATAVLIKVVRGR